MWIRSRRLRGRAGRLLSFVPTPLVVRSLIGLSGASRKSRAGAANPRAVNIPVYHPLELTRSLVNSRIPRIRETRDSLRDDDQSYVPSGRFEYRPRQEIVKTNNYSTVQIPRCAWAQREDSGENSASRGEKRETRGRRTKKKGEGRTRRRSDGVINDRVFNTLYGLAYKLRAVHRSSWQRINGRGAEHEADLSLSLFTSFDRTSPST